MAKKRISYDLFGKLQIATIEREVEDAYNGGISLFFADSPIEHPFNCDGFISEGLLLRLLIEYKLDEILSNPVARARVLVQVLFYMKKFEDGGLALPNVIMVGDKNECFVIHSNDIVSYLDADIDWTTAPSNAAVANPRLVREIAENTDINPFIFMITEGFDISRIVDRIRDLSVNVKRYVRVTEHNIAEIFDNFSTTVLRNPDLLSPSRLVEVFLGILLDPMSYYQHPRNRNLLVTKDDGVPIFGDAYRAFFDYYNQSYTPREHMKFTEIADRLIEDTERRRNGEFFTPVPFVDYAHRMIEHALGLNWKELFTVWDASAGTKNLTRDYRFSKLYCSTLKENDLNIGSRYNTEATSFVFDFLNGDMNSLPVGLRNALASDMPIVSLQNPPYGRAGRDEDGNGTMGIERGAADTETGRRMKRDRIGACSANLYAQFMYRLLCIKRGYNLTNFYLGLFTPTLFFTGSSFKRLREEFYKDFAFLDGVQFRASEFAAVKDSWAISFTLWGPGETDASRGLPFRLIQRGAEGRVEEFGTVRLFNIDNKTSLGDWLRGKQPSGAEFPAPNFNSALNVATKISHNAREGMLGSIINSSNNIDQNATGVAMYSGVGVKGGNGIIYIGRDNFLESCAFFAAKKLISCDWINSKNEYTAPDESAAGYADFLMDSLVFSIFFPSQQASLRGVACGDVVRDVKNEFFFMSKSDMESLADEHSNIDCWNDARTDHERYAFTLLSTHTLSREAKDVWIKAKQLVTETFEFRQMFNIEHPDYQINNWDAGWYQLKPLIKEYNKVGWDDFQTRLAALAEKMRPMVYQLGFLPNNITR